MAKGGNSVKITGLPQLRRRMASAAVAQRHAFGAALYREGLRILAQSLRLVPVDTGRLRATGYVSPPTSKMFVGQVVEVGYGTQYAPRQHEDVSLRHTVGQSKFLQQPAEQAQAGLAARVAADTARLAARGAAFGVRGAG